MNRLITALSTIVLAGAIALAQAQETNDAHAGHHPATTQSPQDAPPMQKMRDLMARIRTTEDPAVRTELLKQHRELMQAQMKMMDGKEPMGEGCGEMMQMMMEQMMEHMTQSETR